MRTRDHNGAHGRARKKAGELEGTGSPTVDEREKEHRAIVCGGCRHRISDESARMEMGGRHEHTFVNPAGYTYRIGCFSRAPGCVGHGESSTQHTWFPGFAWQISLCARCHMHLGWSFASEGSGGSPLPDPPPCGGRELSFHGLIVDRISFGG